MTEIVLEVGVIVKWDTRYYRVARRSGRVLLRRDFVDPVVDS